MLAPHWRLFNYMAASTETYAVPRGRTTAPAQVEADTALLTYDSCARAASAGGPADGHRLRDERAQHPRLWRPVRRAARAPVLRVPGAGVRDPDARGGRLVRAVLLRSTRSSRASTSLTRSSTRCRTARSWPTAASHHAATRPRVGRGGEPTWPVRLLRDQRRNGPAVPLPHPRPVVRELASRGAAYARQSAGGHDGRHGQPRPRHGRHRQVSVVCPVHGPPVAFRQGRRAAARRTRPPLPGAHAGRRHRHHPGDRHLDRRRPAREHRDRPVVVAATRCCCSPFRPRS